MDKIVVLTDQSEPDYELLAWLNELFPDCEVQVSSRWTDNIGEYPASCFHFRLQRKNQER